jgi:hypothetical protein
MCGFAGACLLGFRVRIPPGAWFLSCDYCVFSGWGPCVGLITRPEVVSECEHGSSVMIYLFTAIGFKPGGSSTVHIYTQKIHRTTQSTQPVQRTTRLTNWEECRPCPVFASYTLSFALQLRKKHGKNLSQDRKILVRVMRRSWPIEAVAPWYKNTTKLICRIRNSRIMKTHAR